MKWCCRLLKCFPSNLQRVYSRKEHQCEFRTHAGGPISAGISWWVQVILSAPDPFVRLMSYSDYVFPSKINGPLSCSWVVPMSVLITEVWANSSGISDALITHHRWWHRSNQELRGEVLSRPYSENKLRFWKVLLPRSEAVEAIIPAKAPILI